MMNKQPTQQQPKRIIESLNSSETDSFADLNPLPKPINRSAEGSIVESIELNVPANRLSQMRSVEVSQELEADQDQVMRSAREEPAVADQRLNSISEAIPGRAVIEEPEMSAPGLGRVQSRSQIISSDDPEVIVKRPYSQLKQSGQPESSISDSSVSPIQERKENRTLRNVLISAFVGVAATLITHYFSKSKGTSAVAGLIVGGVVFDTLRKNH